MRFGYGARTRTEITLHLANISASCILGAVLILTVTTAGLPAGRAQSEPKYMYYSVSFAGRSDGIVLATKSNKPYLLATVNDGRTWSHRMLPFRPAWLHFVTAADGWAVAGSPSLCNLCHDYLYRTVNGGGIWRRIERLGNWRSPGQIQFVTPKLGWLHYRTCGRCSIKTMQTKDGGISWRPARWPFSHRFSWEFLSPEVGWALELLPLNDRVSGCSTQMYVTYDAGRSWSKRPTKPGCYSLPAFANPLDGWMVVDPEGTGNCSMGGCANALLKTTNAGRTWTTEHGLKQDEGRQFWPGAWGGFPEQPYFPNKSRGWIVFNAGAGSGTGGVSVTEDGGRTWHRYLLNIRDPSVAVLSGTEAWLAAINMGPYMSSRLMHTQDGALHWKTVNPRF